MNPAYPKVAQLKTVAQLRERLAALGCELPIDEQILTADEGSPLARPLTMGRFRLGNRCCIHPMEGWDAKGDGSPSEHTLAAVADVRQERGQADLGGRGRGRRARGSCQS